jgi:hypothetical protein
LYARAERRFHLNDHFTIQIRKTTGRGTFSLLCLGNRQAGSNRQLAHQANALFQPRAVDFSSAGRVVGNWDR